MNSANERPRHALPRRRKSVLLALLWIAASYPSCSSTTICARASLRPHIDLTQLTLEELLDLEVIPDSRQPRRPGDDRGCPT
ncbi:MAG: hypothetical protein DHS20C15_06760 [Planctomycetota bacterium]|nr:MAG: hypothetical protein DHS20C15_06760 [Planctomycetota bacterium]